MDMNKKATISFVLALVSLLILFVWPSMKGAIIVFSLVIIAAIVAIVLGFSSRKAAKDTNVKPSGLALAGIIIGFIVAIWGILALIGIVALNNDGIVKEVFCNEKDKVTNCVDNGDGTSACKYMDTFDITCPNN